MEEAKKMKCYKRLIYKQFVQISGLYGPHSFWVICQNVSRTFVELCMETSYWAPFWCTNMASANQQKHLEFTFSTKALFFTRELEYVRINIFSNTWNGYTADNEEERLFFKETAFLFWCHALWKLGSSNCSIFEMKHVTLYGNGNLFFAYLQPSVNKNS